MAEGSGANGVPSWLPVLLFLRNHAAAIQSDPDYDLPKAIAAGLGKQGPVPPADWFAGQLKKGKCLILLDGLDEVADPDLRKAVVAWVETQMAAHAPNRFMVTSRPHGYHGNPLSGVAVLAVQPFDQTQVEKFVTNWYRANEIMSAQKDDPGVRMVAQDGAEDLLNRLRNTPSLADLAVNPLLLTMIATVHRYRSSLPGRRVELYAEICEVFLGQASAVQGLDPGSDPGPETAGVAALGLPFDDERAARAWPG